jgi:hypothetical protein
VVLVVVFIVSVIVVIFFVLVIVGVVAVAIAPAAVTIAFFVTRHPRHRPLLPLCLSCPLRRPHPLHRLATLVPIAIAIAALTIALFHDIALFAVAIAEVISKVSKFSKKKDLI